MPAAVGGGKEGGVVAGNGNAKLLFAGVPDVGVVMLVLVSSEDMCCRLTSQRLVGGRGDKTTLVWHIANEEEDTVVACRERRTKRRRRRR